MVETALDAESARATAETLGATVAVVPDTPEGVWAPSFPSPNGVRDAADLLPSTPVGHVREGPSWRITVSPGKVKIWTIDEARAERRDNVSPIEDYSPGQARQLDLGLDGGSGDPDDSRRARQRLEQHSRNADMAVPFQRTNGYVPERVPSRYIVSWSRKSRNRFFERMCDLDYTALFAGGRLPAVGTLTYPGCWLRVAPNGRTVKKHMKSLRKRFQRAFGEDLLCVWKAEFQARPPWKRCHCAYCDGADDGRAPHVHMLMTPPHHQELNPPEGTQPRHFRQWLSETWAEIVDHPDPEQYAKHVGAGTAVDVKDGLRCTDPRRVATYFLKHGAAKAKEYQHFVPCAWREPGKGPGRFWGVWGLPAVCVTRGVSLSTGQQAGRTVRRYAAAQGRTDLTPVNETAPGQLHHEQRVKVTHEVRKPRTKAARPISKYPDVMGLAGAQLLQSPRPAADTPGTTYHPDDITTRTKYRTTRTPVVRAKHNRGWISLNNAPAFAEELACWLNLAQIQAR